ncbi:hypothetical protein ACFFMN_32560 [Planobispora siamensis]|uniref:Capsular polysaccharide biosynthesis protein n=1 Tax=Planobispora siamensis TaxID=936338 RepID=A0A8J3SAT0_9ACTN|nr:hypothetical protein [Planobispora siamensis]GIH91027.1 hypothetical protein Psi01_16570 [Planobispora siamensis]
MGPPLVLLSVLVGALAFLLVPPTYSSSAFMVLTMSAQGSTLSQDPAKPNGLSNPLLEFNDGLKTTSAILIQAVGAPDVLAQLGVPEDGSIEVTIDDGRTNPDILDISGPYVYVKAQGGSAAEVRGLVAKVQKRVVDELTRRQKELRAPPITYITVADVVPPTTPEEDTGDKVQFAGLGFVLTLAGSMSTAYFLIRRRALRGPRTAPEGAETPREAAAEGAPAEDSGEAESSASPAREPSETGPPEKGPPEEVPERDPGEDRPDEETTQERRREVPVPRMLTENDDTQVFMVVKTYGYPRGRAGNGDGTDGGRGRGG